MKQLFACLIVFLWGLLTIGSVLVMILGGLSLLSGLGFMGFVSIFSLFWLGAIKGLVD